LGVAQKLSPSASDEQHHDTEKATLQTARIAGQYDAMKIFERTLDARIQKIATLTLNPCGFVKGLRTTDTIHAVRLLKRHRENNKSRSHDFRPRAS
jgi:hypothetical protein